MSNTDHAEISDVRTDSPDSMFMAAQAAVDKGDYDFALQQYSRLMLLEPHNVDYIFGYAQVLFWSNNVECSIRFLEQARRLAPDYEDIWKLEYRARITSTSGGSNLRVDAFREVAAERFPDADWHRRDRQIESGKYRWEIGADRDYLSNSSNWEQFTVHIGRSITARAMATLSASRISRFDTTDTQVGVGGALVIGRKWTVSGEVAVSSAPTFIPDFFVELALTRRFGDGWIAGVRSRRRAYQDVSVDSFALLIERYFGKFRIAHTVESAHISSEHALINALTVNFFSDSGPMLGAIIAAGEEIEFVSPGQLLKTDVTSVALVGRHPISAYLNVGWRLATHQQGNFYRRNSIGLTFSGGF